MRPNETSENTQTGVAPYKNVAFEGYITWRALGGLIIDEEYQGKNRETGEAETATNKIRQMSLAEFCTTFQVDRRTIWRWKTNTPNLATLIRNRRNEIAPLARETLLFNQLFLLGMQNKDKRAAVEAIKLWTGHFSELQLPIQRQDVKVQGGLMDVLAAASRDGIIEGEISAVSHDTGASNQASGPLPNPS